MKKILTIVGARPQFVKAAVLSRKLQQEYSDKCIEMLVHTGQHYDHNMSDVFFDEMDIPKPHTNLEIGALSHGAMTGRMLEKIEELLVQEKPDYLLVYGDTNSTLAGALAASKLHIPVVHIEAGLRSFNKAMPEEQNRVLTDHLADFLFCPTDQAIENLKQEGITHGVYKTGDIMLDASLFYRAKSRAPKLALPSEYMLITLHRAENTDNPDRLKQIIKGINDSGLQGVLPLHPRTKKVMDNQGLRFSQHIQLVPPVSFFEMLYLEEHAKLIVTDSGGVQKEAYFFQKPCVTLRDQTEWVETVEIGVNTLAGADAEAITQAITTTKTDMVFPPVYGSGKAAEEILDYLL